MAPPISSIHGRREVNTRPPVLNIIPVSPRWDSLPNSPSAVTYDSHSIASNLSPQQQQQQQQHQQTSHRTRAESSPSRGRAPPRSIFPGLSSNPFIPETPEVEVGVEHEAETEASRQEHRQFPLLVRRHARSSAASSANSHTELRQPIPPEGPAIPRVENFSRPRKPSLRSQQPEAPLFRPLPTIRPHPEPILEQSTPTQLQPNFSSPPYPWPRNRGLSGSSSQSSSTLSSIPNHPSSDHLAIASRNESLRQASPNHTSIPGPSSSPARPSLVHAHSGTQPSTRELPPWVSGGDELRSSFRSQFTASTAQTTLFTATGTERSSVLTKTSSVTEQSIINGYARTSWRTNSMADDGPSLEDVMGMYERGFNDSDIESIRRSMRYADDDDDTQELDMRAGFDLESSRPATSYSETTRMGAEMLEAMNDHLPLPGAAAMAIPMPKSNRNLTKETAINHRTSLLPSSLPKDMVLGLDAEHLTSRNEWLGKHDSGKMLDGDDDQAAEQHGRSKPASPSIPLTPLKLLSTDVDIKGEKPPPSPSTPAAESHFPPDPPEDPKSRDRYGFRKANSNITREEYDAWDMSYNEYLSRRRKKWVAFLKDSSLLTDNPNRFPPRSAKTKRFVRKGIPPDWRGAAWFYYAGGPAILSKHRGLYDDLVKRSALRPKGTGVIPGQTSEVKPLIVEDIEKDLHRTFPDNVRFRLQRPKTATTTTTSDELPTPEELIEPDIISSLRRVLHAFALYNPRIGYCQSLNFLAGLLLIFVETEEQAFWLLNVITRVYLPGTHEMSLEGSKVDLGVLMVSLKDSLPSVWKQIGGDENEGGGKRSKGRRGKDGGSRDAHNSNDPNRLPAITLCMTAWFMSCFIGTLPMETVLRVWDVFFYEGSRTLFRIALTIFKLAEPEIKAVSDPMEMFGVVQGFPRKLLDSNALMDACYKRRNGIGHLSQEAIEEKRAERRDGIRRWKAEQDAAVSDGFTSSGAGAAGLDLAADLEGAEVRRKGTLFGRRKDREQVRAAEVI
ncbi:hypothetical protein B0T19DRAFT_359182 [Cercophora scortea]|uniref:Rab-GAP TBC domain-containing protein n=1 Tax=Cercophora scortea TaxID=314031 RepID=A0AAE0IF22_9PEZI|nr:hypothetical protein B0T19DRAFT_359182 [Cercophora scortea]